MNDRFREIRKYHGHKSPEECAAFIQAEALCEIADEINALHVTLKEEL